MPIPEKLRALLMQKEGTVTTAEANKIGISNERLRLLVKSGELERAAFGVYVLPDEFIDKMYIAQLKRPKIIYSHETALFLHDLTDRDPISYAVTMFGYIVIVYGLERTICDCLRSRNRMDISVVTDAVKRYVLRKDKDLYTLMKMAETFGVSKLVRSYMEVLL